MVASRLAGIVTLTLSVVVSQAVLLAAGPDEPLLERDVLPILTKNCMGCHGGLVKEGGLDLRTLPMMLAGGESGPAIASRKAEDSLLWKRIANDEMPAGDDREKLSTEDKAAIKTWIDAGLPTVTQRQQNVDPLLSGDKPHSVADVSAAIDQHIARFLDTAGMQPALLTDDQEFLRRVYLDLTGRVPTADQAVAFLDNDEPDRRRKLIDSLLETSEFGEEFGRTWRDWVCPPELPSTGQRRRSALWAGPRLWELDRQEGRRWRILGPDHAGNPHRAGRD